MKKVKTTVITLFLTGLLGFTFYVSSLAQEVKYCATDEKMRELYKEHPELLKELLLRETSYKNVEDDFKKSVGVVYVIPVVVHVVHNNGPENISDAQVRDGIRVLNEDFRKWNADTSDIVTAFKSIAADSEIEFRLAQKDPSGNCTNGIVRVQTFMTNDPNGIYELDIKADRWPVDKYLNIWTAADIGGAAGYAYLPPANSSRDGIMNLHNYFGSIGTSSLSSSRTLTHEAGHYLGLSHTWGWGTNGDAGNCSADDGVSDTPNTIGHFGCNLTIVSCSSLDNIQNHMDYTSCRRMFTEGQKTRMRTRLTNSFYERNNLWTTSNLIATGTDGNDILCEADFIIDNTTICAGEVANFIDVSYNGQTTWNWSFPGGTPSASIDENPTITYNAPGIYDVSLTVGNGTDNVSTTKTGYITVMYSLSMPYSEGFESGSDWEIINNDGGNTWEYTTSASYSGSGGSLKMNNYSGNTAGEFDEALSPPIDLSVMETVQLTFKVAYAQKSSTDDDDILKVYISRDCGNIWSLRWGKGGTSLAGTNGVQSALFTPTDTSQWQEFTILNISLSDMTENFRFKFEFTSDGGNNLYIDDINIYDIYTIPILISPSNYSTDQSIDITLDWNAVADVDYYQYEFDTSLLFSSPLLISGTKTYISSSNNNSDTEYQISNLDMETTYYWRVRAITGIDTMIWSSVWRFMTVAPVGIDKAPNSNLNLLIFPNPVEDYSVISFNLYKSQYVTLKVYDILGREILNLIDEKLNTGTHRFKTRGIENSGIYFVRLVVGKQEFTKKIIIR